MLIAYSNTVLDTSGLVDIAEVEIKVPLLPLCSYRHAIATEKTQEL